MKMYCFQFFLRGRTLIYTPKDKSWNDKEGHCSMMWTHPFIPACGFWKIMKTPPPQHTTNPVVLLEIAFWHKGSPHTLRMAEEQHVVAN